MHVLYQCSDLSIMIVCVHMCRTGTPYCVVYVYYSTIVNKVEYSSTEYTFASDKEEARQPGSPAMI